LLGFYLPAVSGVVFNILTINRYRRGNKAEKRHEIISGSWLMARERVRGNNLRNVKRREESASCYPRNFGRNKMLKICGRISISGEKYIIKSSFVYFYTIL